MYINVIGVIKNLRNETIGYRLLDTDDNNKILDVKKEQLISVMQSGKLKVENIKLVNRTTIQGKYYSVELLPILMDGSMEYQKLIVLNVIDNNRATVASCAGNVVTVNYNQLKNLAPSIINIIDGNLKCDFIETDEYKESINNSNRLEREARDPNAVWTFKDFYMYMKSHGWDFTMTDSIRTYDLIGIDNYEGKKYVLKNIDRRCKIIHLPKDTQSIYGLYDVTGVEIDTLIINKECNLVKSLSSVFDPPDYDYDEDTCNYEYSIKNLYFQNCCEERELLVLKGLDYTTIHNDIVIPNTRKLVSAFNKCKIKSLKMSNGIIRINNSFNYSEGCIEKNSNEQYILDTKEIIYIYNSYNNIKDTFKIIIKGKCDKISSSFKSSCITEVDFSEATELTSIAYSFNEINIECLDLSKCDKLDTIGGFSNCIKLKNLILPKTLRRISGNTFSSSALIGTIILPKELKELNAYCFINSNINELILPSGIVSVTFPIGSDKTLIKYSGSGNKLAKSVIHNISEKTNVDFGDSFDEIVMDAYEYCNKSDIVPRSIKKLHNYSFRHAEFSIFDTGEMPELSRIPTYCFAECKNIDTVIINDNIKSVDEQAFVKMKGLNRVIISGKASGFNSKAFSRINFNNIPPRFYVVSTNEEAKKLLKQRKIEFNIIDKIEDVINNDNETALATQSKYKLIIGGDPKYQELLKEPYIHHIDKLFKLVNEIDKLEGSSAEKFSNKQINTAKFVNLELCNYNNINMNIHSLYNQIREGYTVRGYGEKMNGYSDTFVGICNFITTLYNNCKELYTEDFIRSANGIGNINLKNNIYIGTHYAIVVLEASTTPRVRMEWIAIILDDNIVFQTPFKTCEVGGNTLNTQELSIFNKQFKTGFALTDYLIQGDTYVTSEETEVLTVDNVALPNKYNKSMMNVFENNFILIGSLEQSGMFNDKKPTSALFYDTLGQKFVEMKGIFSWLHLGTNKHRIIGVVKYRIERIYDLKDITSSNVEYFKCWLRANKDEQLYNMIKLNSMSKDKIDAMFNDVTQYNLDGNQELCLLADYIYKNNIRNIANMTSIAVDYLLSTTLFEGFKPSISACDKKNYVKKVIPLDIPGKMLIHYITNESDLLGNYELLAIIDSKTSITKSNVLKLSRLSINSIITSLYCCGEYRAHYLKTMKPTCKITDDKINIDEYTVIETFTSRNLTNSGFKFLISLDKLNCDVYLLLELWDMDFYKLFRFKDIHDLLIWLLKSNKSELMQLGTTIVDYNSNRTSTYTEVRNAILDGYPNCYPYVLTNSDLFKILAKQMK